MICAGAAALYLEPRLPDLRVRAAFFADWLRLAELRLRALALA